MKPRWIAVLTLFFAMASAAAAEPRGKSPLSGHWRVAHVLVDSGASRRQTYQYDDSQLVGRHFDISADAVRSNVPEGVTCKVPNFEQLHIKPERLFADTLAPRNAPPIPPTAADFGLSSRRFQGATVFAISCRGSSDAFGPSPAGANPLLRGRNWLVRLNQRTAILHWFDDTLLELVLVR